jgi:hypothetical protein
MNTEMLVATTVASGCGAAMGWLAARWIYRSEARTLKQRCIGLEKTAKLWKGVADDACAELARISQHTMNRRKSRSEASRRGWQTRRNGWNIAAHAPDCAVALNGRHDCSCGVDAAKLAELDAAGTGITDGKGKNDR